MVNFTPPAALTPQGRSPSTNFCTLPANFVETPFSHQRNKKGSLLSRKCSLTIMHSSVLTERIWGRSVSIMTGFETRRPRNCSSIPGRSNNFFLSAASGPALRHTKPAIQRKQEDLSPRLNGLRHRSDRSPHSSVEFSCT